MSDLPSLQFDRPEFQPGVAAGVTCTACKQQVVQSYYVANGHVLCSACRDRMAQGTDGSGGGRMLKAFFSGLGVALLGGIVWFAVAHWMNMEIGLLSIAIGYCVGRTVRWASGHRGGRADQGLAVLLTPFGIASPYLPQWVSQRGHPAKKKNNRQSAAATPAPHTPPPPAA